MYAILHILNIHIYLLINRDILFPTSVILHTRVTPAFAWPCLFNCYCMMLPEYFLVGAACGRLLEAGLDEPGAQADHGGRRCLLACTDRKIDR